MGEHGFSKLNEEYTRSSVFQIIPPPPEGYGLQGGTRINLGFGRCLKLRVKAERDEGSLRIGGLALAANCHHIVLIFGFFFLLAGAVLTTLAYKTKSAVQEAESLDVGPREDGRIAGPLFVVIGSTLIFAGVGLTLVGWKVNQEARRQRNHFTLQTPPPPTPDSQGDYFGSGFANIHDSNFLSRVTTPSTQSSRRGSFFSNSVFSDRRKTLPTIAQAVPIGFFVDGRLSGVPEGVSISSRPQPSSPNNNDNSKEVETDGNTDSNETNNINRKASLSLRPSLPIPIIASPSFIRSRVIAPLDPNCLLRTRSDEPFGSIVSLSGTGDIACFPAPPTPFAPCLEEELPSEIAVETQRDEETAAAKTTIITTTTTAIKSSNCESQKLPSVQVNELTT